jgi:hypothetical protein
MKNCCILIPQQTAQHSRTDPFHPHACFFTNDMAEAPVLATFRGIYGIPSHRNDNPQLLD